jgi:hypothetical protein
MRFFILILLCLVSSASKAQTCDTANMRLTVNSAFDYPPILSYCEPSVDCSIAAFDSVWANQTGVGVVFDSGTISCADSADSYLVFKQDDPEFTNFPNPNSDPFHAEPGQAFQLSYSCPGYVTAWADWNQSGSYEVSELLFVEGTNTNTSIVRSHFISIPSTACTGLTRVRLLSHAEANFQEPCPIAGLGQVVELELVIGDSSNPAPTCSYGDNYLCEEDSIHFTVNDYDYVSGMELFFIYGQDSISLGTDSSLWNYYGTLSDLYDGAGMNTPVSAQGAVSAFLLDSITDQCAITNSTPLLTLISPCDLWCQIEVDSINVYSSGSIVDSGDSLCLHDSFFINFFGQQSGLGVSDEFELSLIHLNDTSIVYTRSIVINDQPPIQSLGYPDVFHFLEFMIGQTDTIPTGGAYTLSISQFNSHSQLACPGSFSIDLTISDFDDSECGSCELGSLSLQSMDNVLCEGECVDYTIENYNYLAGGNLVLSVEETGGTFSTLYDIPNGSLEYDLGNNEFSIEEIGSTVNYIHACNQENIEAPVDSLFLSLLAGEYQLTAAVTFPGTDSLCGFSSNAVFITVIDSSDSQCGGTSLLEFADKDWSVTPVPASGEINIEFKERSADWGITLYDVFGREVMSAQQKRLDVSILTRGVYILELSRGALKHQRKIILE